MQAGFRDCYLNNQFESIMSSVGTTKDQVWWDNVKIEEGSSSSNPRWRCNHCGEEYSGSAEMIRNHLAGQGTGIASCPKVDPHSRELAIMERAKLPYSAAAPVQASSSMVKVGANRDDTCGIANSDIPSMEALGNPDYMIDYDSLQLLADYGSECNININTPGKALGKADLSDFCWDNVEKLPGELPRWRCKHCRSEFSGTAPEGIRNHLSGEGNDISPCENVPTLIRIKALNRRPRKKARFSQVSTSMNEEGEEIVLDTLVEFLLHRNVSVDTIMDSHFRGFLKMTAQQDRVPLCLDDPNVIQKLLYGFFERMTEAYIREAKESWKETGCTYIFYNLNEEGQKVSATLGEENFVVGWFSPKGFFFTQESDFDNLSHECGLGGATQYISHRVMSKCHYQSFDLTCYKEGPSMWCVHDRIQRFCRDICKTNWAKDLIDKSKKIYTFMMLGSSSSDLIKNHQHLIILGSSFTLLVTIMSLKDKLKSWLSDLTPDERKTLECDDRNNEIISIIDSNEFWFVGGKLQGVGTSLIKIYDIADNLSLTAGYLHSIITREKGNIKSAFHPVLSEYQMFWECFEEYFGNLTSEQESAFTYLSPACISAKPEGDLNLTNAVKDVLQRMVRREEHEALDAELEAYNNRSTNPLAKIPYRFRKNYSKRKAYTNRSINPRVVRPYYVDDDIKLWQRYGKDQFPLLKKCAMKLLNQPVSCLCNKVKKQMTDIQGTDNLILRLNYKMMTEFKNKRRFKYNLHKFFYEI